MNIDHEIPCITNWIIKYDEAFQMPQFVQGSVLGDYETLKNGQHIMISNLIYMDVGKNIIRTIDNKEFKLIGPGKRMLLIKEEDILKMIERESRDPD